MLLTTTNIRQLRRDKQSSLFGPSIKLRRNFFNNIGPCGGATTHSIMTFSIMTFGNMIKNVTLTIMTFNIMPFNNIINKIRHSA
jgi:hypothetical protein